MPPISLKRPVDHFTTLPQELSIQIIKFLHCSDVGHLAQTSRYFANVCKDDYLWNLMTVRRFGPDAWPKAGSSDADTNSKDVDHLELYKKLSEDALTIPAPSLGIIWRDGRHWELQDDPTSDSEQVAILNSVCWFDVRGSFKSIPRGTYTPTWKLRLFGRGLHTLPRVTFRATVSHPDAVAYPNTTVENTLEELTRRRPEGMRISMAMYRPTANDEWSEFELPALNVGQWEGAPDYLDVDVEAIEHGTTWKFGLKIDWCKMVKAKEEQKEERDQEGEVETAAVEDGGDETQLPPLGTFVPMVMRGMRTGLGSLGSVMRGMSGL